ncbi:hypothetical protein LXA43DRAFT_1059795 [Ganoderma leucocontextum]|nr:hypothetical protein LXA43DRAFT_1059795 [Ganoderma leucocontextum]
MSSSHFPSADSIYCALFSRGDGKFHWTIVIPSNNSNDVEMLHVRNPSGGWSFERKTHDVSNSLTACVIVKTGHSHGHPTVDKTIETQFTCRVWFKQAIRVLAANGVLRCPDVYALEREIIRYGEAQDAKTIAGMGYKYHVASVVHGH